VSCGRDYRRLASTTLLRDPTIVLEDLSLWCLLLSCFSSCIFQTSKAADIEEGGTESTGKEEIILEAKAVEVPAGPTIFAEVLERGRASAEGSLEPPLRRKL
jgi:hypothetical protein